LHKQINEISGDIHTLRNSINTNSESISVLNNSEMISRIKVFNNKSRDILSNTEFGCYIRVDEIQSKHVVTDYSVNVLRTRFNMFDHAIIKCQTYEIFNKCKSDLEGIIKDTLFCEQVYIDDYDGIAPYTYSEILRHYKDSDYMTALFIMILGKTVKERHNKGGYNIDMPIDDGDVSYLSFVLKNKVGLENGLKIIDRASEYRSKIGIQVLLGIANNSFSGYSYKEILTKYANILKKGDNVTKYLNSILGLGDDGMVKVVRKLKNNKGFMFYSKALYDMRGNQYVLDAIYTELEKDIKEHIGVAIYNAIDLKDVTIAREIFSTDKYDKQLIEFISESDDNFAKVKDCLDCYEKDIKPRKTKA
jgi:hypothetical protein